MKATLALEYIGADMGDKMDAARRLADLVDPGSGKFWKNSIKPWVSEITGHESDGRLQRRFIDANRDYSRANSKGSRGVMLWYILESDRLYEVKQNESWNKSRRYFCSVSAAGEIVELSQDLVQEWLSGFSA